MTYILKGKCFTDLLISNTTNGVVFIPPQHNEQIPETVRSESARLDIKSMVDNWAKLHDVSITVEETWGVFKVKFKDSYFHITDSSSKDVLTSSLYDLVYK